MWAENELYEKWRDPSGTERESVDARLFDAVAGHAQAVVWQKLHESNPDLIQEIVLAVYRNISRFKGESKFSTWVHAIAKNKVSEKIRRRTQHRKLFNDYVDISEESDEALWQYQPDFTIRIAIDELAAGLSATEQLILWGKHDNFTDPEIAKMLGKTSSAVESKWRRLKEKMRKK